MQSFRRALAILSLVPLAACAAEWDSEAYAPATFATSGYAKVLDCQKSPQHGGKYVRVWVADAAKDAFTAKTYPFAEGTIFVKEGFEDSGCSDRSKIWVMKKGDANVKGKAGDWHWQELDGDGVVVQQGQPGGFTGCHAAYNASDFVGTQPK